MRRLLVPSLLVLLGVGARPRPALPAAPATLFAFDRANEADWDVVNDGVMGGHSAGFVAVAEGTLRFTGTLVTQDGGFTSVRARRDIDLTGPERPCGGRGLEDAHSRDGQGVGGRARGA